MIEKIKELWFIFLNSNYYNSDSIFTETSNSSLLSILQDYCFQVQTFDHLSHISVSLLRKLHQNDNNNLDTLKDTNHHFFFFFSIHLIQPNSIKELKEKNTFS